MRRIVFLFLLIVGIGSAYWWFNRPEPVYVALADVEIGAVEASVSNTRAGTVEACQRTRLSPISGGRIAYLGVKKGDYVKKGQVLLRLWNEDQQAQSAFAQTQVTSSQKHVGEICALADQADREAERMAKLRSKGFVSEGGEEKVRYEAKSRRAGCEAALADVSQAKARVKISKTEQNRTLLTAPFDGIVADIIGELGEYTTPSPPGVATPPAIDLIDDSCLYVSAPMDEVDAPKIRVGQLVRISLDALPGKSLQGHVRRVAPYIVALEKQSRTVDVEVSLDNSADIKQLLVGYSADIEIVLDKRDSVMRIPSSTLMDGNKVLLYKADTKTLEERTVKTGIANWSYTEIQGGLSTHDKIVASLEREGVKAGAKVMPQAQVK